MHFTDRQTPAQQLRTVAWRYMYPRSLVFHRIQVLAPAPAAARERKTAARASSARDERLKRLESILLLAREPLSSRKLSDYANLADGTEARTLIRRLNNLY